MRQKMKPSPIRTHDLCRLCSGRSNDIRIFAEQGVSDVSFAYKVNYTVNIKVQKNDDRLTVCNICKNKVEEFYDFKSMCRNTETRGIGCKQDLDISRVKIKEEPMDEDLVSTPSSAATPAPSNVNMMPTQPLVTKFANGAPMMFPTTYYMLDPNGKFVPCQMPALVPIGDPIPISSLSPSSLSGTLLDAHNSAKNTLNDITSVHSGISKVSPSIRSQASTSVKSNRVSIDSSPCSDDLAAVDDIINEVHTDNEEDIPRSEIESQLKSDGESVSEEESGRTKMAKSSEEVKRDSQASAINITEAPTDSDLTGHSAKESPVSSRRGQKRKPSTIVSVGITKRLRSARTEGASKTLEEKETGSSSVKRTTRSSTGSRPRRVVVDSDSDNDYFGVDDPDAVEDPEYSTTKKRGYQSSSDSSSDSEEEKSKSGLSTVSALLKSSRKEKEEALKKSCPHCQLTYKHWVSYDDHVKKCAEQKINVEPSKVLVVEKVSPADRKKEQDTEAEIKCVVCLKKFKGSKALREHMSAHELKKGPSHQCKECNETFADKGRLICHNALRHKNNISVPILKPEKKKPYCTECNKQFTSSSDLICHQVLIHKKK